MSTVDERRERTEPGSEWLSPARARKLRADVERAKAALIEAGETIIRQERIIRELRAERPAGYTPTAEA